MVFTRRESYRYSVIWVIREGIRGRPVSMDNIGQELHRLAADRTHASSELLYTCLG